MATRYVLENDSGVEVGRFADPRAAYGLQNAGLHAAKFGKLGVKLDAYAAEITRLIAKRDAAVAERYAVFAELQAVVPDGFTAYGDDAGNVAVGPANGLPVL